MTEWMMCPRFSREQRGGGCQIPRAICNLWVSDAGGVCGGVAGGRGIWVAED